VLERERWALAEILLVLQSCPQAEARCGRCELVLHVGVGGLVDVGGGGGKMGDKELGMLMSCVRSQLYLRHHQTPATFTVKNCSGAIGK
jgi:hypothetical protein